MSDNASPFPTGEWVFCFSDNFEYFCHTVSLWLHYVTFPHSDFPYLDNSHTKCPHSDFPYVDNLHTKCPHSDFPYVDKPILDNPIICDII